MSQIVFPEEVNVEKLKVLRVEESISLEQYKTFLLEENDFHLVRKYRKPLHER